MKTISRSKTSQYGAGINQPAEDIKITNPVCDIVSKYLMEDNAIAKILQTNVKYYIKSNYHFCS